MNLLFKPFVFGSTALLFPLSVQADQVPQSQVSFTQGTSSTWNADWNGASHRAYFFQWSLDLVNWQFVSFMEFGTGIKRRGIATENAPRFFVRLVYYDDPDLETLEQAMNADFDRDGIPNIFEINAGKSNPLDRTSNGGDSDGDGLGDGWEIYHFGNLAAAGSGNPDGDSLVNAYEAALGSDPNAGLQTVPSELQLFIPSEP